MVAFFFKKMRVELVLRQEQLYWEVGNVDPWPRAGSWRAGTGDICEMMKQDLIRKRWYGGSFQASLDTKLELEFRPNQLHPEVVKVDPELGLPGRYGGIWTLKSEILLSLVWTGSKAHHDRNITLNFANKENYIMTKISHWTFLHLFLKWHPCTKNFHFLALWHLCKNRGRKFFFFYLGVNAEKMRQQTKNNMISRRHNKTN